MDEILSELGDLKADVATVKADTQAIKNRCGGCQDKLEKHEHAIYGNGKDGLDKRVAIVEGKAAATAGGKTDTFSIKGMVILFGSLSALISGIVAAVAAALARGQ
jgi:hypothetical protein